MNDVEMHCFNDASLMGFVEKVKGEGYLFECVQCGVQAIIIGIKFNDHDGDEVKPIISCRG